MAIEMYPGKTGDRLILRDSATEGSYADITVRSKMGATATVRLVDHSGYAVVWPALTPLFRTLNPVDARISRGVESDLGIGKVLGRTGLTLDDLLEDHGEAADALLQRVQPKQQDRVREKLEAFLASPPVCPRIMEGQPMQLVLDSSFSTRHSYPIGIVEGIEIYNAEAVQTV